MSGTGEPVLGKDELLRQIAAQVQWAGTAKAPPGVHPDYAQGRKDFALALAHLMDAAGQFPKVSS